MTASQIHVSHVDVETGTIENESGPLNSTQCQSVQVGMGGNNNLVGEDTKANDDGKDIFGEIEDTVGTHESEFFEHVEHRSARLTIRQLRN